jgi:hypothetical protein
LSNHGGIEIYGATSNMESFQPINISAIIIHLMDIRGQNQNFAKINIRDVLSVVFLE